MQTFLFLRLIKDLNYSSILFTALSSMAEIPALFSQRPIVDRHQRSAMYHPFIESLALTLVDIPITFVTMVFFSILCVVSFTATEETTADNLEPASTS
jgi:ABC-type multidrug transport system permease subunit